MPGSESQWIGPYSEESFDVRSLTVRDGFVEVYSFSRNLLLKKFARISEAHWYYNYGLHKEKPLYKYKF